MSYSV